MWIVELKNEPYVWLSEEEWQDDKNPPQTELYACAQTYLYACAQTYETEQYAHEAIKWARTFGPFPNARIVKVDPNFE